MESRDSGSLVWRDRGSNSPKNLSHPGFRACLPICTLSNSEESLPARGTSQDQLCRLLSDPDVWTPPWLSGSQLEVELLKTSSGIHAFNYYLSIHLPIHPPIRPSNQPSSVYQSICWGRHSALEDRHHLCYFFFIFFSQHLTKHLSGDKNFLKLFL